MIIEARETRGKTRTQKFRSGSGQVSLYKISGLSGYTWENPKNLGRVSGIFGFLHTHIEGFGVVWF